MVGGIESILASFFQTKFFRECSSDKHPDAWRSYIFNNLIASFCIFSVLYWVVHGISDYVFPNQYNQTSNYINFAFFVEFLRMVINFTFMAGSLEMKPKRIFLVELKSIFLAFSLIIMPYFFIDLNSMWYLMFLPTVIYIPVFLLEYKKDKNFHLTFSQLKVLINTFLILSLSIFITYQTMKLIDTSITKLLISFIGSLISLGFFVIYLKKYNFKDVKLLKNFLDFD